MKLEEFNIVAKPHNTNRGNLLKNWMIKSFQTEEGNFDCFATANNGVCDQVNCFWRKDCFAASKPN